MSKIVSGIDTPVVAGAQSNVAISIDVHTPPPVSGMSSIEFVETGIPDGSHCRTPLNLVGAAISRQKMSDDSHVLLKSMTPIPKNRGHYV